MNILAKKPRVRVMAAFDALPEKVRRAIAAADFAYDPEWVADRLKRSRRQKQLVAAIRARTARKGV